MFSQKKTEYKPNVILVLFGVAIILALYFLPVYKTRLGFLTIAKTVEICSSPFPLMSCYTPYPVMFYFGLFVGIVSILAGIFNKKEIK
jgi:hypothetical protein